MRVRAMTIISTSGNDNAVNVRIHELIIAVPKRAAIYRVYRTTSLPYNQYIFVGFFILKYFYQQFKMIIDNQNVFNGRKPTRFVKRLDKAIAGF